MSKVTQMVLHWAGGLAFLLAYVSGQTPRCAGSDCLVISNIRHGTRYGTPDSLEADIRNISDTLFLRGYVYFPNARGRLEVPTGLMKPGEKSNVYACHVTGEPSVAAETGADVARLRYPTMPPRKPAGLVLENCVDEREALRRETVCNVRKLNCNESARSWCSLTAKERGPAGSTAFQQAYDACFNTQEMSCEVAQAECLTAIKRCAAAK